MSLVPWREFEKRFEHVDGRIVAVEIGPQHAQPRVVVRFYPFWEHPRYRTARAAGEPWGFTDGITDGQRDVAVLPLQLLVAHIDGTDATDLWFSTDEPRLRAFERTTQVFVNGPVDMLALTRGVRRRLGPRCGDLDGISPLDERAARPPFALTVAASLFAPLVDELDALGVPYFPPRPKSVTTGPQHGLVLAQIGESWLVARDFTVEVPEFEHRDEWFAPR